MKVDSATWIGQTVSGRYEVTSKLGEGGMGLVYRATDRKSGQQVVIKAPLPAQLEQQGGAERFAREIRSQMKLPHQHIVSVLDVGEHEGIPFAVMPYLGGGSLKDALPVGPDGKRGPLAPHEFEIVKSHTVLGDELFANLRSLQPIRPIIRWHHERLDGSGYPDGLRGDEIPMLAQIVGVVDVFEAITRERPYQRSRSPEGAVEILRKDVQRGWRRREIVEAFSALMVATS